MRGWLVVALGGAAFLVMACGDDKRAPKGAQSDPTPPEVVKAAEDKAEPKAEPKPDETGAGDAEPSPKGDPASEAPPKVPPKAAETPKTGAGKPSGEAAKAAGKRFLVLLNEGREHVKGQRYPEGIAKLKEALKIDPANPTALGELGWAHFKAGELERARAVTDRALALQRLPKKRAMLLYNLGRVEEEEGSKEAALSAYKRSLSLRENKTVRGRMEALEAEDVGIMAYDKAEELCPGIKSDWDCEDEQCECSALGLMTPDDAAGGGIEGYDILTVKGFTVGEVDADHLVVFEGGKVVDVGIVANRWSPGAFGIDNDGKVTRAEFVREGPGVGARLVVESVNHHKDSDMGTNAWTESTTHELVFCADLGAGKRSACLKMTTAGSQLLDRLFEDQPAPPEEDYGKMGETAWALDWSVAGDKLKFAVREGKSHVPERMRELIGTHDFEALGKLSAVEVIELR